MSKAARTYNQDHIARKYTPGKRRLSIYWSWSYPWVWLTAKQEHCHFRFSNV
jgi:hypothetical protein